MSNGFLVCEKCNGYYELQANESPKDFDCCQCGGKLFFKENLEKISVNMDSSVKRGSIAIGKTYTEISAEQYKKRSKTSESWVIGLEGENLVLEQLNNLPKDYYVFHDVKLPHGRGNIDHIVIGPTGLFVIETKNYRGKYQINGSKWYYYKKGEYISIDKNPGNQLIRNILDLKDFLNDKGIEKSKIYANGIIAFVQNNYSILQEPENYKVFAPAMIPEHILTNQIKQNKKILAKIALEIEPYCTELTFVPKHGQEIDIPPVSKVWPNESEFYKLIKETFPNEKIIYNETPSWLDNPHPDVYFPDKDMGIVYQKPTMKLSGKSVLLDRQFLDEKKKRLCNENDCKLIFIYPNHDFNEIVNKIKDYLITKDSEDINISIPEKCARCNYDKNPSDAYFCKNCGCTLK